jgi:tetratricopeptide (TPR) repeat protein
MGVVYKAVDVKLKRVVALKMMLTGDRAGRDALARFRSEAEAVARLRHPNIVQIYEIGEDVGCPYFSMEFVDGGGLERRVAGTPQAPRAAAALVATLARAIHTAHQRSIVHRDLKPSNVLLALKAGAPETVRLADLQLEAFEPKIADFGLAKRLDDQGHTQTGAVMGTPSYMAPEQAQGRVKDIGPAADVYALSAILYELLTGRPPFKGTTVLDTLEQVRTQDPVRPTRLQSKTPRDLETICLKGLHKEPVKRYASAADLADDLQRFLDYQTIRARPATPLEAALKWARRRPLQAALAAAILLMVFGVASSAFFYGLYQSQKAAAANRAMFQREKVTDLWSKGLTAEAAGRDDEAHDLWTQALGQVDPADDFRRQLEDRLAQLGKKTKQAKAEAEERQQVQNRVKKLDVVRDDVRFHEINFVERDAATNRAHIRKAAADALGLSFDDKPAKFAAEVYPRRFDPEKQQVQVAQVCYDLLLAWAEAEAPLANQDGDERAAAARRALHLLDAAAPLAEAYHLSTPQAYPTRRASYGAAAGDAEQARTQLAGQVPDLLPLDHFLTALTAYRANDNARAAAECEAVLGTEPDNYWAQYLQALCNFKAHRWGEAKVGFTACLGRRPDFDFWPRQLRGGAHRELSEYTAAAADFEEAARLAGTDLEHATVRIDRGVLNLRLGRCDAAVDDLREAVRLGRDLYAAQLNLAAAYQFRAEFRCVSGIITLQPYGDLANAYVARADLDAAAAVLSAALDRWPRDTSLLMTRGRLHLARNDAAMARHDYEQVVVLEPAGLRWFGVRSGRRLGARLELARLYQRARDYEAALASCNAALEEWPDYAPAHLQLAETLLARDNLSALGATVGLPAHLQLAEALLDLCKYQEAGKALDRYSAQGAVSAAAPYARGLIYARLRQYPEAAEAFGKALALKPDAETYCNRGWVYLRLDAPQLALADFQAALRRDPASADALSGRGRASVLLGDVASGVADSEVAVKKDPSSPRMAFNAACANATAAALMEKRGFAPDVDVIYYYQVHAVRSLGAALERVPEAERAAFWSNYVRPEPVLAKLQRLTIMRQLDSKYGSPAAR